MQIRRAAPEDLSAVGALLESAGLPPLPTGQPLSNLLVALGADAVQGAIALEVHGRIGLVRSAIVDPGRTRRGVATSLLHSLLARAQELGLRELFLLTESAQSLFESFGFSGVPRETAPPEIRATRQFREECPAAATLMHLSLESRCV